MMKRIISFYILLLAVTSVSAQKFSFEEPKLDNSRKSAPGTVTLEMLSKSSNLILEWQLNGDTGVKKQNADGSYVYTLIYQLTEDDENLAKTTVRVRIQEVSTKSAESIKMKGGQVWRGSFNLLNKLSCDESGESVYAADKKAKVIFDSPISNLSISMDGKKCFDRGKAATNLSGLTLTLSLTDNVYHYEIIADVNVNAPISPTFVIGGDGFDPLSIKGKELSVKKLYRYSVSSGFEHVETYQELVSQFEAEKDLVMSYTMSSQFLNIADIAEKVSKHTDCPDELRDEWLKKANGYLSIRKPFYAVETFIAKWDNLSVEKGTSDPEAIKYLGGARKTLLDLKEKNPNIPVFAEMFAKYDALLDKYAQKTVVTEVTKDYPVVSGKVYYNEGEWAIETVAGIAIYGFSYNASKPDRKLLKKTPIVGHTSSDGSFRIVLRDSNITHLYFSGCRNSVAITPNQSQNITVKLEDYTTKYF